MPKLTAEQRAALEQQLADDDAEGDDDFDFHYTEGDRSVSLPWSRRESLHELGFTKIPKKPPAAKGAPTGSADPKDGGSSRPRNVSVFGPRQRNTGS